MEEIMNERMGRKLDEFMKRYIGFLQDRHLSQEIISIHCAEIRRYFSWRAEGGNPPFVSGLLTSLDFKAYINTIKEVNPQVANNQILPVLRSFLAFNQEINNYGDNLPGPIPNFLDNQKAKSWLDGEQQRQLEGQSITSSRPPCTRLPGRSIGSGPQFWYVFSCIPGCIRWNSEPCTWEISDKVT
jgi:hypothetical protein